MEMRENMPGILFQSVERARKQAIQTELSRRGLGTLGQPMILFLLKDKGREGRIAAQKELSDAMHVSPATVAVSLKSLEREGYVESWPTRPTSAGRRCGSPPRERPPSRGASRSLRRWTRACSRAFAPRRRGRPAAISCGCSTICGGIFHRKG